MSSRYAALGSVLTSIASLESPDIAFTRFPLDCSRNSPRCLKVTSRMNRLRVLLLSLGSLCWALPGTAQTAPSKWLSYNAATKTVTFALEAGAPGTAGPFNFNGYSNGGARRPSVR